MKHHMSRWLLALALAVGSVPAAMAQKVKLATSMGDIVVQLDAEKAPKTVANFVQYVKDGHYDGLIFHRVIPTLHDPGRRLRRRHEAEGHARRPSRWKAATA